MSLLLTCPSPAELTDVPVVACPFDPGQIQKIGFQQLYDSAGDLNSITSTDIVTLAAWTDLLEATDETKVQFTPLIGNFVTAPAEPNRAGEGNETPDGTGIITSLGQTPATWELIQPHPSITKALRTYFSYGNNLGVYLVNQHGKIVCKVDDPTTPTVCYPIPIRAFFINDAGGNGFDTYFKCLAGFTFTAGWSDNIAMFTPSDFNALLQLQGS